MRHLRLAGAVLALMFVASSAAEAQRTGARPRQQGQAASTARPWEFGIDGAIGFGLEDPRTTVIQLPLSNFRAGYHMSDQLSLEPFGSVDYVKVEGFDGITVYEFGVGGLYHFSPSRLQSQLYVRPFLSLIGVSTPGASDSDAGLGVGLGMKWPRLNGRMALRGEANVAVVNDATSLNLMFGLSFFTR